MRGGSKCCGYTGFGLKLSFTGSVVACIRFKHSLTSLHTLQTTIVNGLFGQIEPVEAAEYCQRPEI